MSLELCGIAKWWRAHFSSGCPRFDSRCSRDRFLRFAGKFIMLHRCGTLLLSWRINNVFRTYVGPSCSTAEAVPFLTDRLNLSSPRTKDFTNTFIRDLSCTYWILFDLSNITRLNSKKLFHSYSLSKKEELFPRRLSDLDPLFWQIEIWSRVMTTLAFWLRSGFDNN